MGYFVGAYASSPNVTGWDPQLEASYYQQLNQLPQLQGLEHPFLGQLHPYDNDWFLAHINPDWDYVFTCIPGIMSALAQNPQFGIASCHESGRALAIDFLKQACDAIGQLNQHLGRQAVKAIQIQSAPSQGRANSSVDALMLSLATLKSWNWHGATLMLEHCDCYIEGQSGSKGFLSLSQEIEAIKTVNRQHAVNPIAMTINWGRSVLEMRHAEGAIAHIQQAKQAGLLKGLMFSGISGEITEYGAWQDTHMPPAPIGELSGAPGSLMTQAQIQACLTAADVQSLDYVGIKLGIRPFDASIATRIAYNQDAIAMLANEA